MASEGPEDDSQKTEEPTQRRLEEADREGRVAVSRELNHWFVLLGGMFIIIVIGPPLAETLAHSLRFFLEMPHQVRLSDGAVTGFLREVSGVVWGVLGLALGVLVITGLSAGGLQTRFKTSSESIRPKFSKISPLQGLKRLFSIRAVIDLVKGILKISLIAGVLFMVLYPQLGGLSVYSQLSPSQVLVKLQGLMGKSVIAVFVIMTIIAALDYIYERFKFTQELRMTREELKQEIKNTEGDPMIKGRLKQMRRDRSRQKMLAAVPSATVVLTNPTHYAVALFYDPATMDAPEVVAKGVEFMAQTIRELATKHKVPIVRNPALARKLYDDVELNESIPQSHYKAVAEVIRYVMALKR